MSEIPHELKPSGVVLLLGAGASVEAGFPALVRLTNEVDDDLQTEPTLQALYRALRTGPLLAHEGRDRNIEDVLSAADAFFEARVLQPVAEAKFLKKDDEESRHLGPRDFGLLAFSVRKHLWRRLSVSPQIDYLRPLRSLVDAEAPLVVGSLNNDLVIETWAAKTGLAVERGFGNGQTFEAENFSSSTASVHLLKLHGSVDWILEPATGLRQFQGRFESGGLIPMRTPLPELSVVFPSRIKVLQSGPLRQLLHRFEQALRMARVLVVMGCSLVDTHVVEALVAACLHNPGLRVLFVDPSTPVALERLERFASRFSLADRLDWLPMPVGQALAGGTLLRRVQALRRGELSPGRTVVLWLGAFGDGGPGQASLRRIEESLRNGVDPEDREALVRSVDAVGPPAGTLGPVGELLQRVRSHARNSEENPEALTRTLEQVRNQVQSLRGNPLIRDGDRVLFWEPGNASRLGRLHRNWQVEWLTPEPLTAVGALTVRGDDVFHFRRNLFHREGLSILRRLDLKTGRLRWRLLRRREPIRQGWKSILKLVAELRQGAGWNRKPTEKLLRASGFLSWPTALDCFDTGVLLVVESTQASLVEASSGRVLQTTGTRFLNLSAAALGPAGRIYLLEGGIEREGRLLAWRFEKGGIEEVVPVLRYGGGLAYDAKNQRLLVTSPEQGLLLEVPLTAEGIRRGEVRVVAHGLAEARSLCPGWGEEWLVSTKWGIAGVQPK